jgi:hypothetical protein
MTASLEIKIGDVVVLDGYEASTVRGIENRGYGVVYFIDDRGYWDMENSNFGYPNCRPEGLEKIFGKVRPGIGLEEIKRVLSSEMSEWLSRVYKYAEGRPEFEGLDRLDAKISQDPHVEGIMVMFRERFDERLKRDFVDPNPAYVARRRTRPFIRPDGQTIQKLTC